MYEELGWESLSDRRWSRRLIQLYKICNELTPIYLTESLPTLRVSSCRNSYALMYQEFKCNTSRYQNSFFPDSIKSWNSIGELSSAPSITIFKKNVFDLIRPKPRPWFDIHDPIGLSFLFQLRVGLSPLRYHKKRHNFIDTPDDMCECGVSSENVSHFLFYCPFYIAQRLNLRSTVTNILHANNLIQLVDDTEIYLYGHISLMPDVNKAILLSTISFIKNSNRFS